jgi:hypothetical protein
VYIKERFDNLEVVFTFNLEMKYLDRTMSIPVMPRYWPLSISMVPLPADWFNAMIGTVKGAKQGDAPVLIGKIVPKCPVNVFEIQVKQTV